MARLAFSANTLKGLGGRDILYTQGKTLGGGSARNYLIYQRYDHSLSTFCKVLSITHNPLSYASS